MAKNRREGHKALRLKDGRLESYDPHQKGNYEKYRDTSIQDTRIRLQLLFEEWDLYRSPKMVLRDILDSWPDKREG